MTSPLPTTAAPVSPAPLTPAAAPFSFRRVVLPHLLAVLALLLLTVVYFSPVFFEGKTLVQSDVLQFKGGAHEIELWREAHGGEQPLWTNSMFSGMPTYLISTHYPGDWSQYLSKLLTLGLPTGAANLFVLLICGYVLFVALGVGPGLAGAGAVMLGFATYNMLILEAGHNTKSMAIAYAPLVIGGVLAAFQRNRWIGAALFTLGLTMQVRSNHPQITYYLGLMLGIYVVIELVSALRAKRLPAFAVTVAALAVGALIAVGVSFGRLYATASYTNQSIRGKSELTTPAPGDTARTHNSGGLDRDYAFQYSEGIPESVTMLVPDFFGGAHGRVVNSRLTSIQTLVGLGVPEEQAWYYLYWGDGGSIDGPVYLGAITFFLFILGLLTVEARLRWWLLGTAVLGLVLAWGKNMESVNYFLFDHLPGYNKFRALSMAVVLPQLAIPLLAILAAWGFLRSIPGEPVPGAATGFTLTPTTDPAADARLRSLRTAVLATVGILVLLLLISFSTDPVGPQDADIARQNADLVRALRDDRASLAQGDIYRALFFVLAAAAVLYFAARRKLSVQLAALSLGALTLLDQWTVDKRHLNASDFQENVTQTHFEPTPADQQILQDKDLSYRVLNLQNPFNDARTSYFHKSVGGYHGAKLRRYQDLIERQISRNNTRVLDMLNTRYIMPQDPRQPVQRNPSALGNAWLVREVKTVPSADAEMSALTTLEPGTTAVVDASKFADVKAGTYDPAGSTIKLTDYAPDKLTYAANLATPGVALFSEVYYANGWNAYVDGQATPHFRANWILRGLALQPGTHKVEFRFEPKEYAIGNTVSLISSGALVLVLGAVVAYTVRRRRADD